MMGGDTTDASADQFNRQQWIWVVEDELGSLIWVTLRDETHYVGIFKSFDQYGNIMLTDTVRKIIVNSRKQFSDVYCGNMIIRGESIAYFCGVDVEAYLRTFNYGNSFDRDSLLRVARKRQITAASPQTSAPLNYVEIDEALKLLKAEQDGSPEGDHALTEMLGNDPFV